VYALRADKQVEKDIRTASQLKKQAAYLQAYLNKLEKAAPLKSDNGGPPLLPLSPIRFKESSIDHASDHNEHSFASLPE